MEISAARAFVLAPILHTPAPRSRPTRRALSTVDVEAGKRLLDNSEYKFVDLRSARDYDNEVRNRINIPRDHRRHPLP